jgi:hypothetical protein
MGLSVSYLSPLFLTLSVQFLIPLSLSLCFLPPSLIPQIYCVCLLLQYLTPSSLSLSLNPESAPGIREDLTFLRAREARSRACEPAKT